MAQTSYLSQISQIISVEKNLSCGEISDFCKEFEQFMEFIEIYAVFVLNLCGENLCEEKMTNMRSGLWQFLPFWPVYVPTVKFQ